MTRSPPSLQIPSARPWTTRLSGIYSRPDSADWGIELPCGLTDQRYWLSTREGQSRRGTFMTFEPRMFGLRVNYTFGAD
jgi:hypothetical protein